MRIEWLKSLEYLQNGKNPSYIKQPAHMDVILKSMMSIIFLKKHKFL
jgi:hypothetical protein